MKEQYHLVSFSGGKDSTAMLLGMLERDMKIDCILFCDTGLEFPAMYDHIAKVEKDIGRKITSVRAEHTYEELIYDEGFDIDQSHTDDEDEPCAVCISMPKSLFTDSNLDNLKALIAAKGGLIKKALGVPDLPLEITDTKVSFPWFPATPTPDEMKAYDTFICKLCEMARNQKRINTTEKPTDNEKYAFRCFLLRLGFIGAEYKTARKILLKNLSGSSAFRNGGAQHEISE